MVKKRAAKIPSLVPSLDVLMDVYAKTLRDALAKPMHTLPGHADMIILTREGMRYTAELLVEGAKKLREG